MILTLHIPKQEITLFSIKLNQENTTSVIQNS